MFPTLRSNFLGLSIIRMTEMIRSSTALSSVWGLKWVKPLEKLYLNTKGKDNAESKFLVLSSASDCLGGQEQRLEGAQLYGHQNEELCWNKGDSMLYFIHNQGSLGTSTEGMVGK